MRRRVQYHKVLKAAALLEGRSVVEDQDLGVIENCLGVGVLAAQKGPGAAKFSDVFRGTQMQFSDPKREAQLRVIGAAIDGVGIRIEEAERVRELVGISDKLPKGFCDEVEVARWMADRLTPDSSVIQDFQDVYRRRRVNAA